MSLASRPSSPWHSNREGKERQRTLTSVSSLTPSSFLPAEFRRRSLSHSTVAGGKTATMVLPPYAAVEWSQEKRREAGREEGERKGGRTKVPQLVAPLDLPPLLLRLPDTRHKERPDLHESDGERLVCERVGGVQRCDCGREGRLAPGIKVEGRDGMGGGPSRLLEVKTSKFLSRTIIELTVCRKRKDRSYLRSPQRDKEKDARSKPPEYASSRRRYSQ